MSHLLILTAAACFAVVADPSLPIPSADELAKAETEVREIFGTQLKAVKSAEDRQELARQLELQALDSNNSAAVRYSAFRIAESVVIAGGDVERAFELIDVRAKHFSVKVVPEKIAVLTRFVEGSTPAVRTSALTVARREFASLAQTDDYDDALALGREALNLAKAARDKTATDEITALGRELRRRQEEFGEVQAALKRLEQSPNDAAAHLTVGRWIWHVKGDVPEGLMHLAAGADQRLAAAAKLDLSGPQDVKQMLKLGDEWQALAEKQEAAARTALLTRADHWYSKALPGLNGLDKARAEKQLAALAKQLRPAAPPTPAPPSVAAKPNQPTNSGWKPPGRNSTAAFRSFMGFYMYFLDRDKAYPVANLQVPNKNLWSKEIQDKLRGKIPFDEISYFGTAKIAIPADGVYVLDADRGKVTINGLDTGGNGEVKIVKGIHVITFEINSHGGPYIEHCILSLKHKETGEEVTFFNTWQDIQKFLATPIKGQRLTEVSGWEPTMENELKIDPKTLKVLAK